MTLPVSGLRVRFRSLTEREYAEFQRAPSSDPEVSADVEEFYLKTRARLICLCLCDEAGRPILNPGDADELGALDAGDTAQLFDRLSEFCGLNRSPAAAMNLEKKGSKTMSGCSSPTTLPPTSELSTSSECAMNSTHSNSTAGAPGTRSAAAA
jgi:hypothetical protein